MADNDDDTNNTIMRLDDGRVLKKLGRPLNTPITHHAFSEAYSRHWFALMDAHTKFENAMFRFLLDETQSPSKWWSARRRFIALERETDRCVGFWIALGGNTPLDAAPVFKSEQDAREYALLDFFISKRACPFLEFWQIAIEEAEAGNVPTFKLSDIPPWLDDELWSNWERCWCSQSSHDGTGVVGGMTARLED